MCPEKLQLENAAASTGTHYQNNHVGDEHKNHGKAAFQQAALDAERIVDAEECDEYCLWEVDE